MATPSLWLRKTGKRIMTLEMKEAGFSAVTKTPIHATEFARPSEKWKCKVPWSNSIKYFKMVSKKH